MYGFSETTMRETHSSCGATNSWRAWEAKFRAILAADFSQAAASEADEQKKRSFGGRVSSWFEFSKNKNIYLCGLRRVKAG